MAVFPTLLLALICAASEVLAADGEAAVVDDCFTSASIVGAVLGSVIILLALEVSAYLLWRLYWRSRRGQHLVLVTDPEKGGEYAFDNPCFKDATPVSKAVLDSKEPAKLEPKNKWTSWGGLSGLGAIKNNLGGLQGEKRRAVDDSFPAVSEPQVTQVSLRSHDITGLGFNICGNMRDGIFVKDVLHRGPASESGLIFPGDRIHGIHISLRHVVFEDALTILSYASPYEVTLEVEQGSSAPSSRPSSLLRREREKEKEQALTQAGQAPADRIVHPYYRSQSIADLAQIGKGGQKRAAHGLESSPCRSETPSSSDYPTLKLLSVSHGLHTSTPYAAPHAAPHAQPAMPGREQAREQAREHARHEGTAAVIVPSSSVLVVKPERSRKPDVVGDVAGDDSPGSGVRVHKPDKVGGVRVLPVEPTERRQNVHNAYLERGIDVPDGYNPYSSTSPTGRPASAGFHDVDLGGGEESATKEAVQPDDVDAQHRVGVVAREVKTKITKGIHSLLHSLDRKKSTAKDDNPVQASQSPAAVPPPEDHQVVADEAVNEVLVRRPSGRGIPTEIPEEVRLAAMAARSNRKSLGPLTVDVEAKSEVRAVSRNSSASGASGASVESGHGGQDKKKASSRKGMAPRPPSHDVQDTPHDLVNGVDAVHSDSDSELDLSGPRTTIELTASHITIHHSPSSNDEETTRKAASLGDLSRIDDKLPTVTILERAVSLDLVDGSPGLQGLQGLQGLHAHGGKKRKAPAAPGLDSDDLLLPDLEDEKASRKEPRLDLVHGHGHGLGLGLNTFERSRLKKSSDWGTMEEALNTGHNEEQVFVLSSSPVASSTAPVVAEVIPKGELKNSFFVGMKFGEGQNGEDGQDQPFSFTATLEPLSIEVRPDSNPAPSATTPDAAERAERDKVLWSRVSVSPPPDHQDSGPSSLSSLTIVSSTPMHPSRPSGSGTTLQSPLISSSDVGVVRHNYVTTTQLNSLGDTDLDLDVDVDMDVDMDARSDAFLTAVDSTLLGTPTATPPPDLPTSPVPVGSPFSSLTYITEIQVTTPDSSCVPTGPAPDSAIHNGYSSAAESPSPALRDEDDEEVDDAPTPVVEARLLTPSPPPPQLKMNGCSDSEVAVSTTTSVASTTPSSTSVTTSSATPRSGKNVSVTAIQGSRIPVRATSHSPEDRPGRGGSGSTPSSPSTSAPTSATSSPLRPPVPARRTTDLSPRKANGVQIVSAHSSDRSPSS